MKTYKGIIKGNTIVLDERPDLPDECQALVEITSLDQGRPGRGNHKAPD